MPSHSFKALSAVYSCQTRVLQFWTAGHGLIKGTFISRIILLSASPQSDSVFSNLKIPPLSSTEFYYMKFFSC